MFLKVFFDFPIKSILFVKRFEFDCFTKKLYKNDRFKNDRNNGIHFLCLTNGCLFRNGYVAKSKTASTRKKCTISFNITILSAGYKTLRY